MNEQFYEWLHTCPCKFKYNDLATDGKGRWIAYEFHLSKPPNESK